jgi:hypothetical protein
MSLIPRILPALAALGLAGSLAHASLTERITVRNARQVAVALALNDETGQTVMVHPERFSREGLSTEAIQAAFQPFRLGGGDTVVLGPGESCMLTFARPTTAEDPYNTAEFLVYAEDSDDPSFRFAFIQKHPGSGDGPEVVMVPEAQSFPEKSREQVAKHLWAEAQTFSAELEGAEQVTFGTGTGKGLDRIDLH